MPDLQRPATTKDRQRGIPNPVRDVDGVREAVAAGFWGMLFLMAAGGLGSYWLLRSTELGLLARLIDRLEVPERMWLKVLAAFAFVLFVAGVLVLVNT